LSNGRVVVDVQEDQLPIFLLEADEYRIKKIENLRKVVNENKVLPLFGNLHVKPENVWQSDSFDGISGENDRVRCTFVVTHTHTRTHTHARVYASATITSTEL
jgi:hypothetical protein